MNKEEFRLLHHKAANLNEDVMSRYYGIKANKNAPVRLDEVTLNRILDKHGKNGLIAVSANRSDKDEETNVRNTQSLINDLKSSGYSYLPTYGGYRGTNGVEDSYEPSFVVFNYGVNGEPTDFEGLYEFALEICKKYEQDSVLVKYPNQPPIYVDADGNKVNRTESDKYWKNDPKQAFFTSLKNYNEVDKEVEAKLKGMFKTYCNKNHIPQTAENFEKFMNDNRNAIDNIGKRYTYDIQFECYVNPMPCQLTEMMRRNGEVMIWD